MRGSAATPSRRAVGCVQCRVQERLSNFPPTNPTEAPTAIATNTAGMASIRASIATPRVSCAFAAARQKRKIGATRPSFRPLSTFSNSRSRAGTRRSRISAAAGPRSVGTTTVASTASNQNPVPGSRRNPTPSAVSSVNGRAMPSSRAVTLGSGPTMPPGVSVASTNSRMARTTSTACSALVVSRSKRKTGLDPAVNATPARTMASGAVMLHRASRPATNAHVSRMAMITTSASMVGRRGVSGRTARPRRLADLSPAHPCG